jgi:hypothetical protein
MSRHAAERTQREASTGIAGTEADLGEGKGYSHQDAIAERAKTGMVSPREAEMARGYAAGREGAVAQQALGGTLGQVASAATQAPGVGDMAKAGIGVVAGAVNGTPEANYGAAVGRNRASNSTVQSAAEVAAGMTLGPMGGIGVGMINAGINANKTQDFARMSEAMGFNTAGTAPSQSVSDGSGQPVTTTVQKARQAFTPQRSFESPTINSNDYASGYLSLAQSI